MSTQITKQNQIPVADLSPNEIKSYQQFISQQIIPDPPEELLEVYEKRVLHELSYLRAEKYDSPEHQNELEKIQLEANDKKKIPRNIQNPNYDKLMKFYQRLQPPKPPKPDITLTEAISILSELHDFMMSFKFAPRFEFQPAFLPILLDPRCFQENPALYFCYLITKVKTRITKTELAKFHEFTEGKFDQESLTESLEYLKECRDSPEDYQKLTTQIFQAMNLSPQNTLTLTTPPPKLHETTDLPTFLHYLYHTQS